MTGASISSRKRAATAATFSRTSCTAISGSTESSNSAMTSDWLSYDLEVTCLMPLMVLTASSSLRATSVSTISGAAPG